MLPVGRIDFSFRASGYSISENALAGARDTETTEAAGFIVRAISDAAFRLRWERRVAMPHLQRNGARRRKAGEAA